MRCEGMTKPGIFQFAPQVWTQCSEEGEVLIKFIDVNNKEQELPSCKECWQKCIDSTLKIIEVTPIA